MSAEIDTSGSEHGRLQSTRRLTVADQAGASEPDSTEAPVVAPWNVGRYLVIAELGVGGMGRVYRAYDPKLSREVAVKCLKMGSGTTGSAGSARMLREAKAMAQLAHPNVVPIYDVDVDEGSLFLAMEYVQGETLGEWLGHAHDWRAVIDVFVDAGRGLAAAHAQGIVHRDFKPANVIVGTDGRARVTDFGLARSIEGSPTDAAELETSPTSADLGAVLTAWGTVVGTPRYMAPEQHSGSRPTDARSDQYAFCTALWEGLYGAGPFDGDTMAVLAVAKNGRLPRAPSGTGVPARVAAILLRGLARDPDDRWPHMDALLAALRRVSLRRRSWWLALPIGAAIGVAGFALVDRDGVCERGTDDTAWTSDARTRVESALLGTQAAFAASTWERVAAGLDGYARSSSIMRRDACEATKVRHEQSDQALDLRMACLAERDAELGDVVELLATADAAVLEHAIEIVAGMTPVSRCADVSALRQRVPPPDRKDVARTVDMVRTTLVQAGAHARAGRIDDALQLVHAAQAAAATTDYPPIVAEVDLRLGITLHMANRQDEARAPLERAFDAALVHGLDLLAADAALRLTGLITATSGRATGTEWLAKLALAFAEGDGTDVPLIAHAMVTVGGIYTDRELELEAEPYLRGAVERIERELGPEHPELVPVLMEWSELAMALDRDDEAQAAGRRALRIAERAYGPDHPQTASAMLRHAWLLAFDDRFAEAEQLMNRALELNEAAFGPEHMRTWSLYASRAAPLAEQGKYDEALQSVDEAWQRMGDSLPEVHPTRARVLHNRGTILALRGDHREAIESYRRATEIRRSLGLQHDLAAGMGELGHELVEVGEIDEARRVLEECERIDAESHADDGRQAAVCTIELAELVLQAGDASVALQKLDPKAMGLPTHGRTRIHADFLRGRALWESGGDRADAREQIEHALAEIEPRTGASDRRLAGRMRAWWDAQRRGSAR